MRKIPLSHSLLHFLDEIDYSEAALSADPAADSLAPAFRAVIDEWETLFKQERLGRRGVVRAEALVSVRNERIDVTTMRLGALARATHPNILARLFKTAPGKFVRSKLRTQCEATKTVIVPELAKLEESDPLKAFGAPLNQLADDAMAALDQRAAAFGARQSTANDVLEWKEGINSLRTTTYAELLKIAVAQNLPKSWVESFFRQSGADDRDDSAADAPAPEDAPTG